MLVIAIYSLCSLLRPMWCRRTLCVHNGQLSHIMIRAKPACIVPKDNTRVLLVASTNPIGSWLPSLCHLPLRAAFCIWHLVMCIALSQAIALGFDMTEHNIDMPNLCSSNTLLIDHRSIPTAVLWPRSSSSAVSSSVAIESLFNYIVTQMSDKPFVSIDRWVK